MDIHDFIDEQVKMLKNQFGKQQIRENVWRYALNKGINVLKINAIIDNSMEIYAEVIKRFNQS